MRAAFIFNVGALEVAESFEALEELVHRLFADSGALGQDGGANTVGSRKLKDSDVRETQLVEAGGVQLLDDAAMNGLGRDTQQCADEDIVGFENPDFLRFGH